MTADDYYYFHDLQDRDILAAVEKHGFDKVSDFAVKYASASLDKEDVKDYIRRRVERIAEDPLPYPANFDRANAILRSLS